MTDSVLKTKSKELAVKLIVLCRELKKRGTEGALYSQLIRCGTSVGANIYEAQFAHGIRDFVSKLEISLKECNECIFWLEILHDSNSISDSEFAEYNDSCTQIRRMLISSINTSKAKF